MIEHLELNVIFLFNLSYIISVEGLYCTVYVEGGAYRVFRKCVVNFEGNIE